MDAAGLRVAVLCLQRKRSSRLSAKSARRGGSYLEGDFAYPGGYGSSRRGSSGTEAAAAAAAGPLIEGVPAQALLQVREKWPGT
jgi:hypothetical protein